MDRVPSNLPNNASRLIAIAMSLGATTGELRRLMGCSDLEWQAYRAGHLKPTFAQLDPLIGYIVRKQKEAIERARQYVVAHGKSKPGS